MSDSSREALRRPASPDVSEIEPEQLGDSSQQRCSELEAENRSLKKQLEHVRNENLALLGKNESLQHDIQASSVIYPHTQSLLEMDDALRKAGVRIKDLEAQVERLENEKNRNGYDADAVNRQHAARIRMICAHYSAIVAALTGSEKK